MVVNQPPEMECNKTEFTWLRKTFGLARCIFIVLQSNHHQQWHYPTISNSPWSWCLHRFCHQFLWTHYQADKDVLYFQIRQLQTFCRSFTIKSSQAFAFRIVFSWTETQDWSVRLFIHPFNTSLYSSVYHIQIDWLFSIVGGLLYSFY